MPQKNNLCAFLRKPAQHYACFSADCTKCGWYKPEAERRAKIFAEKGLTRCPDGLLRFVEKPNPTKLQEEKHDVLISY